MNISEIEKIAAKEILLFAFNHNTHAGATSAAAGKADRFHFAGKVLITLKHKLALSGS